jgi:Replication-relaxation
LDISPTQERLLHSFRRYTYLTVDQVTALHFSSGSAKYVNEVLKKLTENKYLARLDRQTVNSRYIYCLGIRGIRFLRTLGMEVNSFHPSDHTQHSHMHMSHWLATTDFLIAAEKLPGVRLDIELAALYHDLTLKRMLTGRVVPDGFIDFLVSHERTSVWLELDRATEEQGDIRRKARAIVEWCNQFYTQTFGTQSINIAFVAHENKRARQLYHWITLELEGEREINWFLFSTLPPGKLDPIHTFLHPIWKRHEEESLVPLL